MSKPNFFVRALTWIWRGIDGFRKLLHLSLMLIVLGLFLAAALRSAPPILAARSALLLHRDEKDDSGTLFEGFLDREAGTLQARAKASNRKRANRRQEGEHPGGEGEST